MNNNNNILCHIVGINNFIKQKFISELTNKYNNLYFCDLDIITNDIRNGKKVVSLIKNIDKSKKSSNNKKNLVKDLNDYWKKTLDNKLKIILKKNANKIIIILGLCTFHRNHRVKIKIETHKKFFLKTNIKTNAKEIVEYNLKKYKKYIIDGTFPIKYLDHDFLISQREKLIKIYSNMKYVTKTYSTLIKWFDIVLKDQQNIHTSGTGLQETAGNIGGTQINTLWVGHLSRHENNINIETDKLNSEQPLKRKSRANIEKLIKNDLEIKDKYISGYEEKWLALMSSINNNNKYFKKGYIESANNNIPYIEEKENGALDKLKVSGYLYKTKRSDYTNQVSKFKYKAWHDIPFEKRKLIYNIYEYLKDNGVKIIKFKY